MKPVSGRRMCKALERLGWRLMRITSSHHVYADADGVRVVSVPVHKNRDLATGTQRGIMRDAGLTDDDL